MKFLLKNRLKNIVNKSPFAFLFNYFYLSFCRADEKQKKVVNNKKDSNYIYVIRPRTDCVEGLLSLFLGVMKNIVFAHEKNLQFYIDFKRYKTQYSVSDAENAWEYFFKQPSLQEVNLKKTNYILSGFTFRQLKNKTDLFSECVFYNNEIKNKSKQLIRKYIFFSDLVKERLDKEFAILKYDITEAIGVYLRGTDYVKLKPSGEPVQPGVEQVSLQIDTFLEKYPNSNIFLVTEDYEIYSFLDEKYKEKLFIKENDTFIHNFSGDNFLSKSEVLNDDRIERGINYLVKIILLSYCKYFISSITNGSISAYLLKDGNFTDEYIFNLGHY
ncbi:MAG: hypothetical protein J6K96_06820 [Treponema sp.]|nr:hypothetical protein [Treponema sp.]